MLSLSSDIAFVWEPLSPLSSKGIFAEEISEWFLHIHEGNETKYLHALQDTLAFKYNYLAELKNVNGPRNLVRLVRDAFRTNGNQRNHRRPLLKDPIALMSAEWLYRTFDMNVIVLIRNPFAFCASIRNQGFNNHPFEHFLRQEELIEKYLSSYRSEIESFSKAQAGVIEQGCLLWNIIHHVIYEYQEKHNNWLFVRHEDLSLDPVGGFKKAYEHLGMAFSPKIEEKIRQSTGMGSSTFQNKETMVRCSKRNLQSWKNNLSKEEVNFISRQTEKYLDAFYSDWDFFS